MKFKKMIFLFSLLVSFTVSEPLSPKQEIIFNDSEYPKVCSFKDGIIFAFGSVIDQQKSKVAKFDKNGEKLSTSDLNFGYSGSSVVAPASSDYNMAYFYHNKPGISGSVSKEFLGNIKNEGTEFYSNKRIDKIYSQKSVVKMQNGKIIIAGIYGKTYLGEQTSIEIDIYDPITNTFGNGISINDKDNTAYSKYISCYEQKANDVYCVYVSYESEFLSKLNIRHLKITSDGLSSNDNQNIVVKNFFTTYNFIKAIPYNENEVIILYQTGNKNDETLYGNTGKDLFYYHLKIEDNSFIAKRYEYLTNDCIYKEDPEEQNADIIMLTKNKIYAVCEYQKNFFKGFEINPEQKKIKKFIFYNFDAQEVCSPVFSKFDKNLALFYNIKGSDGKNNIAYMILNYPNCNDYGTDLIFPRYYNSDFDIKGQIFLSNFYSEIHTATEIKCRFSSDKNITLYISGTNEKIIFGKDYSIDTKISIKPSEQYNEYKIRYTVTNIDEYNELKIGNTCEMNGITPICLKQCYSCTKTGTNENHYCLGCADRYYKKEDINGETWNELKTENCYPCDISCLSCNGPLTTKTTNCLECDKENGYFPFEDDYSLCISNETQNKWEKVIDRAIYFDETDSIWRKCHKHCSKCKEGGDDKNNKCLDCIDNYHFFCNQTEENLGIAGTCHSDDEFKDNGYYLTKKEDGRNKLCPCFHNCKVCENNEICKNCFPKSFLTKDSRECVDNCGYCLAEDTDEWKCKNCAEDYSPARYLFEKKCYVTPPSFTYKEYTSNYTIVDKIKPYHVIDKECNLLDACREGCFTCSERFTDKCTKCEDKYYREDFGEGKTSDTFKCFAKNVCEGAPNTVYPHDSDVRVGGVPIIENDEKICLNCKLRNNSYRLPYDKIYCGEKIDRTYVDIKDYNTLSECYIRCKSCEYWGNSLVMNCTECRDKNNYDLIVKNCYRKSHKCGIFPYYHNYDLATKENEDNCGEDCDICLTNFQCPKDFPYFVFETHECVEYCPVTDIFGKRCTINDTIGALILMKNPFGLKNPYDSLYNTVSIDQILDSSFFEYFANTYNIDITTLKQNIHNYIGTGKYINLQNSQVISGNNISIKITTNAIEKEKLKDITNSEGTSSSSTSSSSNTTSFIDLQACEDILKEKFGLDEEEQLVIITSDEFKEFGGIFGTETQYQLFSTSLGAFLPLSYCKEESQTVTITNPFNSFLLVSEYQSKIESVVSNGYDAFNVESPFYHDVCTPFTNENGNDVLLDARRKDYFYENTNVCENSCKFMGYNSSNNMYTCKCYIKSTPGEQTEQYDDDTIVYKEVPEDFKKLVSKNSNIEVFKCISLVFSSKGLRKNAGFYILLVCFLALIGTIVFYFVKERKIFNLLFINLAKLKNMNANPPKPIKKEDKKENKKEDEKEDEKEKKKEKKKGKKKKKGGPKETDGNKIHIQESDKNSTSKGEEISKSIQVNNNSNYVLKEDSLNFMSYAEALKYDKRTFLKTYWSFIKMKQILIFTFYTHDDYILRTLKIALFILFVSFYFAFNALFFNDSIMRSIYEYKGNTKVAIHVPNIFLSSICSILMSLIIRFFFLNEKDIGETLCEKNDERRKSLSEKIRRKARIKIIILFAITIILNLICWYYVSAFCAVFTNSQGAYLIDVLISFIFLNLWPLITSFISTVLRRQSLDGNNKSIMYKISQITSII